MTSAVQDSLNTTETLRVGQPTSAQPAPKEWDDMDPAEQAAARASAQRVMAETSQVDPTFDRKVDAVLDQMKRVFGDQKRHPIVLYQITGAMKSAGMAELAPCVIGVNGYNFVIPRSVPTMLPEDVIRILYNAGELSPQVMLSLGLATQESIMADVQAANAVAQQIRDVIAPKEM